MESRLSANYGDPVEVIREMSDEDKIQVVGMWFYEKLVVQGMHVILSGFLGNGDVQYYSRKVDDDRGGWNRCFLDRALTFIILRTSPRRDPAEPSSWKGFFNKPRPHPPQ